MQPIHVTCMKTATYIEKRLQPYTPTHGRWSECILNEQNNLENVFLKTYANVQTEA